MHAGVLVSSSVQNEAEEPSLLGVDNDMSASNAEDHAVLQSSKINSRVSKQIDWSC